MSGRFLFPAALVAAIALPYFAVRDKNDNPLAAWWNSKSTAQVDPNAQAIFTGDGLTPTRMVAQRRLPLAGENYLPSPTHGLSPIKPTTPSTLANSSMLVGNTTIPGSPRQAENGATVSPEHSLSGPDVKSIADLLRFDISPQWVLDRWPRVSTQLAETHLQGLRVPVVSGTRIQDLTGSLTYYFDQQQHVQRVEFQGHTGDPSELIAIITRLYGLRAEPALGGGMYLARSSGKPDSVLRIRYAAVIRSSDPRTSHEIRFELNRTGAGLSREMQAMLAADKTAQQWQPDKRPIPVPSANWDATATNSAPATQPPIAKGPPVATGTAPHSVTPPSIPSIPAATALPAAAAASNKATAPVPRWPYPNTRYRGGL